MLVSIFVRNSVFILALAMSVSALAQEAAKSSSNGNSSAEKKVFIQFDNELVKGQEDKPSLEYIFKRDEINYKKMIKLRENFIPEVRKGKGDFGGN